MRRIFSLASHNQIKLIFIISQTSQIILSYYCEEHHYERRAIVFAVLSLSIFIIMENLETILNNTLYCNYECHYLLLVM